MALKRSGVRSSLAPSYLIFPTVLSSNDPAVEYNSAGSYFYESAAFIHITPCSLRLDNKQLSYSTPLSFSYFNRNKIVSIRSASKALLVLLLILVSCKSSLSQTHDGDSDLSIQADVPDVSILIIPISSNSAKVAVVYSKFVPHGKVKQEIGQLALKDWKISNDLVIQDSKVHPQILKGSGSSTSASFTLLDAPQMENSAPTLQPYLRAFHGWNHIAVIFDILPVDKGGLQYSDPSLIVERMPEEGQYHFEARIKNHKDSLPQLNDMKKADVTFKPSGEKVIIPTKKPITSLFPLLFVLIGAALLSGGTLYYFLSRRSSVDPMIRKSKS